MRERPQRFAEANGIPELKPVLDAWLQAIDDYCIGWNGLDNPFYYNETASLSVFAGAAWRIGGFCLQEYSVFCNSTDDTVENGRGDLYFRLDPHLKTDFNVKAKQLKFRLSSSFEEIIFQVNSQLQKASLQVQKYPASKNCRLLVALFATPIVTKQALFGYGPTLFTWMDAMDAIPAVCRAGYFFEPGKETRGRNGDYWPGVYLLMQEVPHIHENKRW